MRKKLAGLNSFELDGTLTAQHSVHSVSTYGESERRCGHTSPQKSRNVAKFIDDTPLPDPFSFSRQSWDLKG
jgi:hypothetical protein